MPHRLRFCILFSPFSIPVAHGSIYMAGNESVRVTYVGGQAASEDELRVSLGLVNYTTGKGKAALNETNMRPIEVFMCSVVRSPKMPAGAVTRRSVGGRLYHGVFTVL